MAKIFDHQPTPSFKALQLDELDQEGRHRVATLGYFPSKPEWFETITHDYRPEGQLYYEHTLTDQGFEELEAMGLKHPGRGWVSVQGLTPEELQDRIAINQRSIDALKKTNIELNKLLP